MEKKNHLLLHTGLLCHCPFSSHNIDPLSVEGEYPSLQIKVNSSPVTPETFGDKLRELSTSNGPLQIKPVEKTNPN